MVNTTIKQVLLPFRWDRYQYCLNGEHNQMLYLDKVNQGRYQYCLKGEHKNTLFTSMKFFEIKLKVDCAA